MIESKHHDPNIIRNAEVFFNCIMLILLWAFFHFIQIFDIIPVIAIIFYIIIVILILVAIIFTIIKRNLFKKFDSTEDNWLWI
jgi:hypothetical protein